MRRVRDLTDKPFGVDLLTAQPETLTASVDVIIAEGAKAFIAGLGVPVAIIAELKAAGVVVMCMAGSVRHAVKAVEAGCDVVIAQGTEAGGHTGSVASIALWPQVVDAVDVPVIAAGGVVDGRGLAAALALGCAGVWMGTRFIAVDRGARRGGVQGRDRRDERERHRHQPRLHRQDAAGDRQRHDARLRQRRAAAVHGAGRAVGEPRPARADRRGRRRTSTRRRSASRRGRAAA